MLIYLTKMEYGARLIIRICAFLLGLAIVFARPDISFAGSRAVETAGDISAVALPAAAIYLTFSNDDRDGRMQFIKAYTSSVAISFGLKYSIKETRPNGKSQSFPSGHTASSFAAASFIQMRYGWGYGIPAYLAASFVGYSRVEAKKHWTKDVLAGAAIGIAANLIFTKAYKGIVLSPVAGKDFTGVVIGAYF